MKYNLEPILIEKLKEIYGLERENYNYLYKYLIIRTSIFHNKRKVKDKEIFNFILDELNLTLFKESIVSSKLIYEDEEYSVYNLCSEFMDNMKFRSEMEGSMNYKENLEEIFKKGYGRSVKFKNLPEHKTHLTYNRLKALNEEFGANPIYSEGIEGFKTDESHNPFRRSLEERLEMEITLSKHKKSTSTSYISEEKLEDYLIENLHLIEEGLTYIKRQFEVPGGTIDILAKDKNGVFCVIEVKIKDDKSIIWQTIHYPSSIKSMYNVNEVRMITVAPEYNISIYNALKMSGNVEIFQYSIEVENGEIEDLKLNNK